MALDLNKLKKKLLEEKSGNKKSNNEDSVVWNPSSKGTWKIRFLPDTDGSGDVFKHYKFHYNVGKRHFCTDDRECATCQYGWSLYNQVRDSFDDRDSKEARDAAWEARKPFVSKDRFASYILLKEKGKEPVVKILAYPKTIYNIAMEAIFGSEDETKPPLGDISDLKEGSYFFYSKKDEGKPFLIPGLEVDGFNMKTPVENIKEVKKMLQEMPAIDDVMLDGAMMSKEEVMEQVKAYIDSQVSKFGVDAEELSKETDRYSDSSSEESSGGFTSLEEMQKQMEEATT